MNPTQQRLSAEIPGPITRGARRRRLFERFETERRFWPLFRLWLLPVGALVLLISFVRGIAAWQGGDTVKAGGDVVHGWRGFVTAMKMAPVFALLITSVIACYLWMEWQLRTLFRAILQRLFGKKRDQ